MILPEIITGGLQFLKVFVLPDGKLRMALCVFRKGGCRYLPEEELRKGALLFVLIGGTGVLQKAYREGAGEMNRITANPDLLCFRKVKGKEVVLTFMRQDRVEQIASVLEQKGIRVYDIYLSGEKEESLFLSESAGTDRLFQIREQEMRWKGLFRTDRKGNLLAAHIFRRLKFPLLCFCLIVLVCNFFGTLELEERLRRQEALLTARTREKEGKSREDEKVRILSEKVKKWSVDHCALLLDRIARQLPGSMQLTELTVAPCKDRLQAGREPVLVPGVIMIAGESPDSGEISRFCRLLQKEAFCREIELKTVNKISGQERYRFEICLGF